MTQHGQGIRKQIRDLMSKDKKELFSIEDIVDVLKIEHKIVDNTVRQLRIGGEIDRHIDKDINNHYQYAVSIPKNKATKYVKSKTMGLSNNTPYKKRRGVMPTSKEIRSMFAANVGNLAKLEDLVMVITMRYEELEKEMDKIKRAVNI